MPDYLYKFRPTKSLFEFKELEEQEFYFATLKELNDPMEGYKNIFLEGDEIVWRNFLRHYLLCLMGTILRLESFKDEPNVGTYDLVLRSSSPVGVNFNEWPTTSNFIYVRYGSQLFYVNKIQNQYTLLTEPYTGMISLFDSTLKVIVDPIV
jgi:hypothetical protein